MRITDFFNTDYVDYSSYDNLRKIASCIDGFKNSSRKIAHTIIEKGINSELKVSQLNSKMAEFTEYLHGDASSVVVTMAQNFPGTNNMPLLDREGNFGTRFIPEASASRYIYSNGSKEMFLLFNKNDKNILINQSFEGAKIEHVFYLPTLPLLFVNGAMGGVSSGFAQDILPRDPKKVKKYIQDKLGNNLKAQSSNQLTPYFEGFKGTIEQGDHSRHWLIKGIAERKSIIKVDITEIPTGISLKKYIKILDTLEDTGKIKSYKDKSNDDNFLFEVTFASADLKKLNDNQLLDRLKLVKKFTENFTCINENNKIQLFDCAKDGIDHYYNVKIEYLQLRKDFLINSIEEAIRLETSKYLFIKAIVDETLKINKRKKDAVIKDLTKIDNIIEKDGSYDYLLNMNIMSLTKERMEKLLEGIKTQKIELDEVNVTTLEQMWEKDLKDLK